MNFHVLETEGGKLFVIWVSLIFLMLFAGTMHLLGKDPAETGRGLETVLFSSLSTLFVTKLGSKGAAIEPPNYSPAKASS